MASSFSVFHDVIKGHIEQRLDVLVIQRVVDYFSAAAVLDNAGLLQRAQLVRDRRLGHIQQRGQITDT